MIDAKELKKAIGKAQWDLNLTRFCELLGIAEDGYAIDKWREFQKLSEGLRAFDAGNLQKLLDYGQKVQV